MTPYYNDDSVTIYHGDFLEMESLTADVTITDPPYNVGLNYSDGDSRPDYAEWSKQWLDLCTRPVVFTPGTVNLSMWIGIEKPRWVCAWLKPNQCSASALNGFNVWEPILIYGKHRKPLGHDAWLTRPKTFQAQAVGHPCPKDADSWRLLVERFSLESDIILDPFMGSGTTLRAAKDLGRKSIGIEIEEKFCKIAAKRMCQEVLAL
jgi:DNA modification methylase